MNLNLGKHSWFRLSVTIVIDWRLVTAVVLLLLSALRK